MDWKEFTENCKRTESLENLPSKDSLVDSDYLYYVMNLSIFSLRLLDILKKRIFYGESKKVDFAKKMQEQMDRLKRLAEEAEIYFNEKRETRYQYDAYEPLNIDPRFLHAVIGMSTECGELIERLMTISESIRVEECVGDMTADDRTNLLEELADMRWYEAIFCDSLNIDPEVAQERVINKLRVRYPDKFSTDKAHTRDLDAEKLALEGKTL